MKYYEYYQKLLSNMEKYTYTVELFSEEKGILKFYKEMSVEDYLNENLDTLHNGYVVIYYKYNEHGDKIMIDNPYESSLLIHYILKDEIYKKIISL